MVAGGWWWERPWAPKADALRPQGGRRRAAAARDGRAARLALPLLAAAAASPAAGAAAAEGAARGTTWPDRGWASTATAPGRRATGAAITSISPTSVWAGIATRIELHGEVAQGDEVAWATSCDNPGQPLDPANGTDASTYFTLGASGSFRLCYRASASSTFVEQPGITLEVQKACVPEVVPTFASGCAALVASAEDCTAAAARHPLLPGGLGAASQQDAYDRPPGCWWQPSNGDLFFNTYVPPPGTSSEPCTDFRRCICCDASNTSSLAIAEITPSSIIAGVPAEIALAGTVAPGDKVAWAADCGAAVPSLDPTDGTRASTNFTVGSAGDYKLCLQAAGSGDSVAQQGVTLEVVQPCEPEIFSSGNSCPWPMTSAAHCSLMAGRQPPVGPGAGPALAMSEPDRPSGCWWQPGTGGLFFNTPPPGHDPVDCTDDFRCVCCKITTTATTTTATTATATSSTSTGTTTSSTATSSTRTTMTIDTNGTNVTATSTTGTTSATISTTASTTGTTTATASMTSTTTTATVTATTLIYTSTTETATDTTSATSSTTTSSTMNTMTATTVTATSTSLTTTETPGLDTTTGTATTITSTNMSLSTTKTLDFGASATSTTTTLTATSTATTFTPASAPPTSTEPAGPSTSSAAAVTTATATVTITTSRSTTATTTVTTSATATTTTARTSIATGTTTGTSTTTFTTTSRTSETVGTRTDPASTTTELAQTSSATKAASSTHATTTSSTHTATWTISGVSVTTTLTGRMCSSFTCPLGRPAKPDTAALACTGGVCEAAECCESVPGAAYVVLGLPARGRRLAAAREGLRYRLSKELDAIDTSLPRVAPGTTVWGQDEGDGWLRVGDHFLPFIVDGVAAIIPEVLRLPSGSLATPVPLWVVGPWSTCSDPCSEERRERLVLCPDQYGESLCRQSGTRPPEEAACESRGPCRERLDSPTGPDKAAGNPFIWLAVAGALVLCASLLICLFLWLWCCAAPRKPARAEERPIESEEDKAKVRWDLEAAASTQGVPVCDGDVPSTETPSCNGASQNSPVPGTDPAARPAEHAEGQGEDAASPPQPPPDDVSGGRRCTAGHPLVAVAVPWAGDFACDACGQELAEGTFAWSCELCRRELCGRCARPPGEEDGAEQQVVLCPAGHQCRRVASRGLGEEPPVTCSSCVRSDLAAWCSHFYRCSECHYSVCLECAPLRASAEALAAPAAPAAAAAFSEPPPPPAGADVEGACGRSPGHNRSSALPRAPEPPEPLELPDFAINL